MKDGVAYIASSRRGIQVVNTDETWADLIDKSIYHQSIYLYAPGATVNQQAIKAEIAIVDASDQPLWLNDLKVGDYRVAGVSKRLVFATGHQSAGLAIVDPIAPPPSNIVWQRALTSAGGSLSRGQAIALGRVDDKDLALVGGYGTAGGAGSAGVLAIVNITPLAGVGGEPQILSWIPLEHPVGDILLSDRTAIVSADTSAAGDSAGVATLVDLTDPAHPRIVGKLTNIGSRLAITPDGVLLSTNRTFLAGTGANALGGLRTAMMGEAALITSVEPEPIVVTTAREVFQDVDMTYRIIPAQPSVSDAYVRIDVQDGGPVTVLPGTVTNGLGAVTWVPNDILVNPALTYLAKVDASVDGRPIRAFPRRLRFMSVPLALTMRDRLLRIQFALPGEGAFKDHKYGVKVFVAAPNGEFPAAPEFRLTPDDIVNAPANKEKAWPATPGASAWLTTKIDKMATPTGTLSSIRAQAFEIGAVLSGYPKVRVVIVSEATGRELQRQEGVVTQDEGWSLLLSEMTADVQRAAGMPVSDNPVPPPVTFEPENVGVRLSEMIYLAAEPLIDLIEVHRKINVEFALGFYKGLKFGAAGEVDTVRQAIGVGQLVYENGIGGAAKKAAEKFTSSWNELKNFDLPALLRALVMEAGGSNLPPLDPVLLLSTAAYWGGFLVGFVVEQVAVTLILAGITVGVGALIAKAITIIKGANFIIQLGKRIQGFIKAMAFFVSKLAELGASRAIGRELMDMLRASGEAIELFWAKYPKGTNLLKQIAQTAAEKGIAAARIAWKWLPIVDKMTDPAAQRFVRWFAARTEASAEKWMVKWTNLRLGKRAVAEAFEAHDKADELAENVLHVVVAAGNLDTPDRGFVKQFSTKYRDRPEALGALKTGIDDDRYSDEILARTARVHGPSTQGPLSGEALEGTATYMREASGNLDELEDGMRALTTAPDSSAENALGMLKEAGDDKELHDGFKSMLAGRACPIGRPNPGMIQ
jgi:hypothetical protein